MSIRPLPIPCLVVMAFALSANTYAIDFNGTGTGTIPDNTPAGINISFNTAGFNQPVGDVKLKLNISHTWVADLKVTLTSPGGVARLVMMSRVGLRGSAFTGSNDLAGVYTFSDLGGDLWAASPVGGVIPPSNYRTSTRGAEVSPNGTNEGGGCFTSMAGAFAGLSPVDASGIWTVNIADVEAPDTGTVSAATLSLSTQADGIFRNGFEVASRGTCKLARMDFTGRGRSSYVVLRNTGGGANGAVTWFVKDNDSIAGGVDTSFIHGTAADFFVQGDWDGDGLADAAVWRPGAPGLFIIRPSSHPTLLRTQAFGQTNDDPSITDDFDGDGLTDFAVYRAGASTGLPSNTLIKLNATGAERTVVTGANGNFPASGDYNGDGIADIATQETSGANGLFRLLDSVTGSQFSTFTQGFSTDVIVDGNHAGNFFDDITTIREVAGIYQWTTRDSATGTTQANVPFGVSLDFRLNGDYDGDGLDDYSIWRPSTTVGASKFSVRRSSTPATPIDIPMGATGDYPLGSARVH